MVLCSMERLVGPGVTCRPWCVGVEVHREVDPLLHKSDKLLTEEHML